MPFEKGKSGNPETQFSSDNQPENRGRKGKSTTEYLKDLGEANAIEFNITVTDKDGKTKTKSGKVESQSCLNELLANLLFADAVQGNHKARKEILDRVEGRAKQTINHTNKGEKFQDYTREDILRELEELMSDNAE